MKIALSQTQISPVTNLRPVERAQSEAEQKQQHQTQDESKNFDDKSEGESNSLVDEYA